MTIQLDGEDFLAGFVIGGLLGAALYARYAHAYDQRINPKALPDGWERQQTQAFSQEAYR